jgi:hypothetical protein
LDGYFIGVILVDRPIVSEYLPVLYADEMKSGDHLTRRPSRVNSRLFLNGYEDFLPPSNVPLDIKGESWGSRLSRESLLDDLRYYWERELPEQFDPLRPTLFALSVYPLRIIAAEWVNYIAAMSYHIKRLNVELRSLQAWRRRALASQHKIASVKNFIILRTPQAAGSTYNPALEDATGLQEDYTYLAGTLDDLSGRLKNMLPVVTSLVQISDSRRSLVESANVNRLTSLAIVFAPLSFTTGLFSMDTINGPGGAHFWVFFAVAIPITIVVFLFAKPPTWILRLISTRDRVSPRGSQLQV